MPETSTWHHHEDGVILQEVETINHERFRHRGGMSTIKK
ncbi:MAG: HNH endonuclease [Oscillospiraceae bacterium]|nr:HNH endonuclease [Oscillospiraceae bacterium]